MLLIHIYILLTSEIFINGYGLIIRKIYFSTCKDYLYIS